MNDLGKMAAITGLLLSGHVIEFRFEDELPLEKCRALAFRNERGPSDAIVLIGSWLDDPQRFKTIMHEIAHVKRDFDWMADISQADRLEGLYFSEARTLPKPREMKAKDQGLAWVAQAERLCPRGNAIQKLGALAKHHLRRIRT